MRAFCLRLPLIALFALLAVAGSGAQTASPSWQAQLASEMPLLGHRNWILVVDAAYPLQVAPGIETIQTNAPMLEVTAAVLRQLARAPHVQPSVVLDSELAFVPEGDASGIGNYRTQLKDLLGELQPRHMRHQSLLETINQDGTQYHVLILKTTTTLPYSSVFFQLDCRYWNADQDKQLHSLMQQARP